MNKGLIEDSMAVLPIYNCFHPIMKKETIDVVDFNDEIKKLAVDLVETMSNTGNGVGLAANQVGFDKSMFVIDTNLNPKDDIVVPIVMINPKIIAASDELIEDREGCLSVPDIWESVPRSKTIDVVFYDVNMKEIRQTFDGFLARVIQHEYDHLKGMLFFERISPLRRTLIKNKLKKIEKGMILGEYPMILPNGELVE